MGLSFSERGFLEKIIDAQVKSMQSDMKLYRMPEVKQLLQIKNEEDFAYGVAVGRILTKFEDMFVSYRPGKKPLEDELNEGLDIIIKRLRDLKDSIFESG